MTEGLTFKLTATMNGETQEFALGTQELQSVVDALPGEAAAFAGFFSAASTHTCARVRAAAARKECLPTDAAMELAADRSVEVRRALLYSPLFRRFASDETLLRMIAADPEFAENVVEYLDQFESASAEVIADALMTDPDTGIRQRLALNSCTPVRVLKKLIKDKAPEVAESARQSINQRYR